MWFWKVGRIERHEVSTTNGQPVQEAVILPLSARSPCALRAMAQGVRDTIARSDGHADLADLAYTAAVRRDHHEHRLALVASRPAEAIERLDEFLSGKAISEGAHGAGFSDPGLALLSFFRVKGASGRESGATSSKRSPCSATQSSSVSAPFPAMCPGRSSTSSGLARRPHTLERPKSTNRFSSLSRWHSRHSGSLGGSSPTSSSATAWEKSPPLTWPVRSASKTPRRSWPCAAARSDPPRDEAGWSPYRFRSMRLVAGLAAAKTSSSSAPSTAPARSRFPVRTGAVEEFARSVRAEGRFAKVLDVDIAFHSPHVEPARLELEAAVENLNPSAPTIRFVSTVTGQEIIGPQLGAVYWGRNVRDTVKLSDALEFLRTEGFQIALEVGPHPLLASSIADCLTASGQSPLVLPTLRRGHEGRASVARSLSALYARGFDLDWSRVSRKGRFTRFPMYPWQHERFWLGDPPREAFKDKSESSTHDASPRPFEEAERGRLFYELRWEKVKGAPSGRINLEGRWLLIAEANGHAERLAKSLESRGGSCSIVAPSSDDIEDGATTFRGVVYLAGLDREPTQSISRDSIETVPDRLLNQVIHLARSLERLGGVNHPRLWIVTRGAQAVGDDGVAPNLVQSSLWGMARSIALENPEIWGGIIDLDPDPGDARDEANQLANAIGLEERRGPAGSPARAEPCPPRCRVFVRRTAVPKTGFQPWRHLPDHGRPGRPGASGRSLAR